MYSVNVITWIFCETIIMRIGALDFMPDIDNLTMDLDKISKIIFERHRKDISVFDIGFLQKTLDRRINVTEAMSALEYISLLQVDALESSCFLKALSNTFSQFFRDPLAFAYLEQQILPCLAAQKTGGEIRIWSAGSAAGQEAFSLAMLISDFSEMRNYDIRYRIIATDISTDALNLAKSAVFDESAIQNVKFKHFNKYFKAYKSTYALVPEIKAKIVFAAYDLLDSSTAFPPESIYGGFDIVMCSNLLIYYRPYIRKLIVCKLRNSLSEGGYLITGDTEKALFENPFLTNPVSAPSNVFRNLNGRIPG